MYSKVFEEKLGKKLSNSVLLYENGVSTNYFVQSELDKICQYLAKKIENDVSQAQKWHDELINQTDKINAKMAKMRENAVLTIGDFLELKEIFFNHVAVNFAIKRSVDFLPQEIIIKVMDDLEHARLYTEHVYMDMEALTLKLLSSISNQRGIAASRLNCLTFDELEEYLKNSNLPEENSLAEREKISLLWYENGECKIFTGDEATRLKKSLESTGEVASLKGMIAYKGKVNGTAKIIFDPKNAENFKNGDILITGMTRPEFLPLMKRAGAFVTDSGGLLSHAAITARELGKPCVVGTETATKIFKDGDLLEVDANKGIVKLIKK